MIKILGAGISGLTASINLAKAGHDVEIFELREDCGARFNGDLQGLENWTSKKDVLKDLKSMNLSINFNFKPFKSIVISDGTSNIRFIFKRPLFYLVKRGKMYESIDQGLKRQAQELGVKIYFNSKMKEKNVHIIASGPKKALVIAKGISFNTEMEDIAVALIGDKFAYRGYSYLLVCDGYGTMCSVVFGKLSLINKCFEKTKEALNKLIGLKIKNQKTVGGYGYFKYPPLLSKDGKIYIGEAAGLQDALFGFGMRYGITSGYIAAKSIIDNINYNTLIKKYFYSKLRASIVNRFLWETLGDKKFGLIKNLRKSNKLFDLFFKLYNFSFRRQKILFPLALLAFKYKYEL